MVSIIIPAYNESAVMERTLRSLLEQVAADDEIIVSCNGCSDDTASIARCLEPRVRVVETPVPSKTFALNLGDRLAGSFPRIYMDADVRLSAGALEKIKEKLASGPRMAFSTSVSMDLSASSWAVRAYYDIWLSLPYCQRGMIGAGVYALSKAGRERFGEFPDLIADDGYVRALFREHERGCVEDAFTLVKAPASLYWLIRIKTRSRLGGMELKLKYPELLVNEEKNYLRALWWVIKDPRKWIKFAVYVYVNSVSRVLAMKRLAKLESYQWEKDISSR
jgi:glycosyltransferase involved in cell wall biosynthesis